METMPESKIERTIESECLPHLCEIRFDARVYMYTSAARTFKTGFFGMEEKSLPPEWFKSTNKLSLEAIREGDEYALGRTLKLMLQQLDAHIQKYIEKK